MDSTTDDRGASAPGEGAEGAETRAEETGGSMTGAADATAVNVEWAERAGVVTPKEDDYSRGDYHAPCASYAPSDSYSYNYSALASPNTTDPPATDSYICPRGDERWERLHIGQPIPRCSRHGLTLIPVE
ncbi:MAG TPA: hypothetical protein VD968_05970 [Pyrinomonadaceae bacterium]|nr:hypothetical protein [Pyrinomonadaceae bacterium]